MGRKRKKENRHLPYRVYRRYKRYYFYPPDGSKPIPLGSSLAEVYTSLGHLMGTPERTINALFAEYEAKVLPTKAPATQKTNRYQMGRLKQAFGHMHAEALTAQHVARYHDLRGTQSVVQANRELSLLSHILKFGLRWGYVKTNVAKGLGKHKEEPRDRYVSDEEVMAMAEACKDRAPYIPVLMDLAILTGQRERDLLSLTRQQLTDEGILFQQSKTRKKLLVQWSPALWTAIDIALAQHEAGKKKTVAHTRVLVNTRGNPVTVDGLLSMWGEVQRELHASGKISERFTIHDLRAKAASDGGTYQLLGHTSEKTFQRVYVRKPVPVKPTR